MVEDDCVIRGRWWCLKGGGVEALQLHLPWFPSETLYFSQVNLLTVL